MSPSVFVVGHRGMLGHVVARWLREQSCSVVTSDERFDGRADGALLAAVAESRCDAVVNCAGTTPARARDPRDLLAVNALLPQCLAALCGQGRLLVHASSDGVFSGARGGYRVDDAPDAIDPYGISKRLGELAVELGRVVVLRASVVGPEAGAPPRSLLAWVLSQAGAVDGFTNHRWNGVTTLAWAQLALAAVRGEIAPGIHQPGCEPVTKHELVGTIARVFEHPLDVRRVEAARAVDRSLAVTIARPPIGQELEALRAWYARL